MCLAVPAKIISKQDDDGTADLQGNRVPLSLVLVPEARIGDWVLVHAGFAIQTLDDSQRAEIDAALSQLEATP